MPLCGGIDEDIGLGLVWMLEPTSGEAFWLGAPLSCCDPESALDEELSVSCCDAVDDCAGFWLWFGFGFGFGCGEGALAAAVGAPTGFLGEQA